MTTIPEPTPADSGRPPDDAAAVLEEAAAVVEEVATEVVPQLEAEMDALDVPRRALFVHAHPDDETISTGATMAKYAAEGASVTLVTCTRGEEGEVLVPELAHLAAAAEDGLGEHRIGELAAAMEALGVREWQFLGGPGRYRDSGMMGEPSNDSPSCFWRADVDEAAAALADVIRQVRPQVVVTYDENGGYGHPDHIQTHRVTVRALDLAADASAGGGEPWQVGKVYYNVMPRSVLAEGLQMMRDAGLDFFGMTSVDEVPFVVPDEQVTTAIDGTAHVSAKLAAMRAHATQIAHDGPFFALAEVAGEQAWGWEFYRLVRGAAAPAADGKEDDLFAGIA